jgi:hypothetical protein
MIHFKGAFQVLNELEPAFARDTDRRGGSDFRRGVFSILIRHRPDLGSLDG